MNTSSKDSSHKKKMNIELCEIKFDQVIEQWPRDPEHSPYTATLKSRVS